MKYVLTVILLLFFLQGCKTFEALGHPATTDEYRTRHDGGMFANKRVDIIPLPLEQTAQNLDSLASECLDVSIEFASKQAGVMQKGTQTFDFQLVKKNPDHYEAAIRQVMGKDWGVMYMADLKSSANQQTEMEIFFRGPEMWYTKNLSSWARGEMVECKLY